MFHLAVAFLLFLTARTAAADTDVWTTGWPSTSSVTQIAIDPQSPSNIYAIANGGLWKSTNGGVDWSPLVPETCDATSVTVDPRRSNRIELTTYCGVFLSTDSGVTWKATLRQTAADLSPSQTQPVLIDPTHSDMVYIDALSPGFFRSLDGGLNWSRADFPFSGGRLRAIAVDGTVYASSDSRSLFRSSDQGLTWAAAKPSGLTFFLREIVADPVSSAVLYALTDSGLFRSEDRGDSWELRGGGTALSLAIDPTNPAVLYAGALGGIWKSEDSGRSWKASVIGPPFSSESQVIALAINPKLPMTVLAGASDPGTYVGRGLVRTEDGGARWVRPPAPALPSLFRALSAAAGAPGVVYAVAGERLSRSDDAGATWTETGIVGVGNETLSATQTTVAIDPTTPTTLYIALSRYQPYVGGSGQLLKSMDGGASFRLSLSGAVDSVAIDPTDPNRIYAIVGCAQLASSCRTMKSDDGGVSWIGMGGFPGAAHQFLFDPSSPGVLYVLAFGTSADGVFRSADGGSTWTSADAGLPDSFQKLAIGAGSPRILYALTASGVFKSLDGGVSWSPTGLSLVVRDLVVDPFDSSKLYATTIADGVLRSLDAGATWQAFNSGLPDLDIGAIVIDSAGLYLHVTASSGIYDLQLRSIRGGVEPRPTRFVPPRG